MTKIDSCDLTFLARSEEETFELARRLGQSLQGNEVILLIGELGAGKTLMVAGLAAGLGVGDETYVCSPSFTLINIYQGRVPLYHLDLYRYPTRQKLLIWDWRTCWGTGWWLLNGQKNCPMKLEGLR